MMHLMGITLRLHASHFTGETPPRYFSLKKESQSILLTKQFRYPTCNKQNNGWLVEIPAGSIEENESPKACIVREAKEEIGYVIKNPQHICSFYTSPGASTELIALFYAEVSEKNQKEKGGGNIMEQEDIQLIKLHVSEINSGILNIPDAKTILALQWFQLNKIDLFNP